MYCNNCGTQNADGVKFCSNCGAALPVLAQETTGSNQQSVQPVQPVYQGSPVTPSPQKPKNNKKLIAIIGGAVAVIAVIAVVLVIVLASKGKDNKPSNAPNDSKPSVSDVQNNDKQDEPVKPAPTPEETALSRDETAIAFMKAFAEFDFAEADKYCILDFSEIYKTFADINGKDMSEIYDMMSEGISDEFGEEIKINSMQDYYSVIGRLIKDEMQNKNPDALAEFQKYDPEIVGTEKVDLNDSTSIGYLIDDIIGCDIFGILNTLNYSQFINLDDITEAYEIEIADKNGYIDDADSFYIVKYNGEWRVVANAISAFI